MEATVDASRGLGQWEDGNQEEGGGRGEPGVLEGMEWKEGRRQGGREGVIGSWRDREQGSQSFQRLSQGRCLGFGVRPWRQGVPVWLSLLAGSELWNLGYRGRNVSAVSKSLDIR